MPHSPAGSGEERPGPWAWPFNCRAGSRISKDQRSGPWQASHKDLEPPVDGPVTTARESRRRTTGSVLGDLSYINACEKA
jgi:hypothetical protein